MRTTLAFNGSYFNTNRMVKQYTRNAYYPVKLIETASEGRGDGAVVCDEVGTGDLRVSRTTNAKRKAPCLIRAWGFSFSWVGLGECLSDARPRARLMRLWIGSHFRVGHWARMLRG